MGAAQALAWLFRHHSTNAAQATAELPPIQPPLRVEADPVFDLETVEPAEVPALAASELSPIAPPLAVEVEADPASEAAEATEVAASMQSSHATADFALPARLAIVAKLNVASARGPQYRPYPLPPGRAVPLASNAQPTYVRCTLHLDALKPTKRVVIQKQTALAPAVIVDLDAVRKAVQTSLIAKHAA